MDVFADGARAMTRLADLRKLLKEKKIDAFYVPHADEFQSEYLAPYAERLAWLTGFTGSAGSAVIMQDAAAFFTDGRYTLQAQEQVNSKDYEIYNIADQKPLEWLFDNLHEGQSVGFDGWLMTPAEFKMFDSKLSQKNIKLCAIKNPIDTLWQDQPSPPNSFAQPHLIEFSGEESKSKRLKIAADLKTSGIDKILITSLDSIAWLLNIRGNDLPHTPVLQSYLLMDQNGKADLYIDLQKMQGQAFTHLGSDVRVIDRKMMKYHIDQIKRDSVVQFDPYETPLAFLDILRDAGLEVVEDTDPCIPLKAIKNEIEIEGMRRCHIRDGVALTRFLAWLEASFEKEPLTEISASDKLEAFRKEGQFFMGLSFDTISGMGAHGAIVHYRATEKSDAPLVEGVYLLDSGGQYLDGTTDVTRTIVLGTPTQEQKENFTRVLKGHIALANAKFPKGTSGAQLDVLARLPLWEKGLDYDHGTGHGVGSYLNVHEGPQGISKASFRVPLQPGMILSNEPGYYKTGEYGIRIESLVLVRQESDFSKNKAFYGFETITCAPIDLKLVDVALLSASEKKWLNEYHAWVYDMLVGMMNQEESEWLRHATRAI